MKKGRGGCILCDGGAFTPHASAFNKAKTIAEVLLYPTRRKTDGETVRERRRHSVPGVYASLGTSLRVFVMLNAYDDGLVVASDHPMWNQICVQQAFDAGEDFEARERFFHEIVCTDTAAEELLGRLFVATDHDDWNIA